MATKAKTPAEPAAPKTIRVRCDWPGGCTITRTWDNQKSLFLLKGDTIDVPPETAEWLDSLDNWTKVTKRAKKPKKEHQG